MNSKDDAAVEYPYWKECLLFPYRLFVSWWLDSLLDRPSDTNFKRFFVKEFGWFLVGGDRRLAASPCLWNLLGVYLRAKMLTVRSPDLEVRFTYLVDEYSVAVRARRAQAKWSAISDVFPNIFPAQENLSFGTMIDFLDKNWTDVAKAVQTNRLTKTE